MSDVMAAAECYNARRRYSHNVPFDHVDYVPRYNIYKRRRTRYIVTELHCSCCKDKFWDFTEHLQHCRSARHIATMFGVSRVEVLREAKKLRVLEVLEQL